MGSSLWLATLTVYSMASQPPAYLPPGDPGETPADCQTSVESIHTEISNQCAYDSEVMTGIEQTTPNIVIDCGTVKVTCGKHHAGISGQRTEE